MTVLLLALLGCGPKTLPDNIPSKVVTPKPTPLASPAFDTLRAEARTGVDDALLGTLLGDHWQESMGQSPGWAVHLGYLEFQGLVADNSPEAQDGWRQAQQNFLARARAIDATTLSARDQVTLDLFIHELRTGLATDVCEMATWSLSPRNHPIGWLNGLGERPRLETAADGEHLLSRVRAAPQVIETRMANLRAGLASGRVINRHTAQLVVELFARELEKPVADWPLLGPVSAERAGWSPEERGTFDAEITGLAETEIRPVLEAFHKFLVDEVMPVARSAEEPGLVGVPEGDACYQALIEVHTSLPLTAEELHQTGLNELKKIHTEFEVLGERALGVSTVPEIFARLRTDPELYFTTEEEVKAKAEEALGRAKAVMPDFFGRLPQADCDVVPIPDYEAPYTTIAYYWQPAADGSRPGSYYINTYAPETRPRHEAEVLAYHESIPGHHLQIAIGQELDAQPAFRRHAGTTAFVEGWGLYTERLSDEMGLYTGDLDRLGMLSFDAWRASRLVVDTGIHAKGWTREQAETFMEQNTPLAVNNIANEVDRYINTPGQALAYKTGQLEMWALRHSAEEALGDRFDIKGFHDAVLAGGAVTLPVLRKQVAAWVDGVKADIE